MSSGTPAGQTSSRKSSVLQPGRRAVFRLLRARAHWRRGVARARGAAAPRARLARPTRPGRWERRRRRRVRATRSPRSSSPRRSRPRTSPRHGQLLTGFVRRARPLARGPHGRERDRPHRASTATRSSSARQPRTSNASSARRPTPRARGRSRVPRAQDRLAPDRALTSRSLPARRVDGLAEARADGVRREHPHDERSPAGSGRRCSRRACDPRPSVGIQASGWTARRVSAAFPSSRRPVDSTSSTSMPPGARAHVRHGDASRRAVDADRRQERIAISGRREPLGPRAAVRRGCDEGRARRGPGRRSRARRPRPARLRPRPPTAAGTRGNQDPAPSVDVGDANGRLPTRRRRRPNARRRSRAGLVSQR